MDDSQDGSASFNDTLLPFGIAVAASAAATGLMALFAGQQPDGRSATTLVLSALYTGVAAGAAVCPLFALVPSAREPRWWICALWAAPVVFVEYFLIFGGDTPAALRCALAGAVGGTTYGLVMGFGRAARMREIARRRPGN